MRQVLKKDLPQCISEVYLIHRIKGPHRRLEPCQGEGGLGMGDLLHPLPLDLHVHELEEISLGLCTSGQVDVSVQPEFLRVGAGIGPLQVMPEQFLPSVDHPISEALRLVVPAGQIEKNGNTLPSVNLLSQLGEDLDRRLPFESGKMPRSSRRGNGNPPEPCSIPACAATARSRGRERSGRRSPKIR